MPNLVGIGLSQVPTNSMLGGMAYQDPDHASIKNLDLKNISQINSEISSTVVDIFVYDTTKDSDGGEWRHRTHDTSWYNEELNTSNRGSRREFPVVAVIVITTSQLTIYDGDDPDLPLWMKFTIPSYGPGANWEYETPGVARANFYGKTLSSCSMLNGQLVFTNSASGYLAAWFVNFISEEIMDMTNYGAAANQFYRIKGPISERNSTYSIKTPQRYGSSEPDPLIRGKHLGGGGFDVAMTVLPSAPIDPDTNLPTPTVAIATQQGVTVIDRGRVLVLAPEGLSNYANIKQFKQVDFTSDNHIVLTDSQTSSGYANVIYLPRWQYNCSLTATYSSLSQSYNYTWEGQSRYESTVRGQWKYSDTGAEWNHLVTTSDSFVLANSDTGRTGQDGFIRIGNYPYQFMVNRVTTTYNTGWMTKRCELASLMSISDTDLTNGQSEPDRSINNNALTAVGNIVKAPVADGAELVGFSGDGSSNYFSQTYNSDFNITNGNFYVSGWLYCTNVGGGQYIFDRSDNDGERDWELWIAADLKYMTMYIEGGQVITSGNNKFPNDHWFHFSVVRFNKHIKIYINGKVANEEEIDTVSTATSGNAGMKILYKCNSNTKLALFRMGIDPMNDDEVRKCYQDEKVMFEKNAKCTINGTSALFVTGMAYDDGTDTLHVGTSGGRNDFRGMSRINNTTTAVTTAISASNGLIAEQ